MTDRDAFLAAIRAAPGDDLPRLVYADWLEERGEAERAEFIRLACESPPPERAPAVEARLRELLDAHGRRWRIRGLRGRQRFERGFVAEVETAADSLLNVPAEALREHPIQAVRLVAADRRVAELANLDVWETVESLTLNNNSFGTGGRLETLFGPGRFPRLRALSLRNNQVWPEAVDVLAALPVTPQLTRLDLSGNPVSDAGCRRLAAGEAFAGLRELVLRSDELNDDDCIHADGFLAIVWRETFAGLRSLNLVGQAIGGTGLGYLNPRNGLRNLAHLDLADNSIGPGSVGRSWYAGFGPLTRLSLAGNELDESDVARLLTWPGLPALELLDLRDCGEVGALALLPNVLSGPR